MATYWISPEGELRRNHLAMSFFCSSLSSGSSSAMAVSLYISFSRSFSGEMRLPLFGRIYGKREKEMQRERLMMCKAFWCATARESIIENHFCWWHFVQVYTVSFPLRLVHFRRHVFGLIKIFIQQPNT